MLNTIFSLYLVLYPLDVLVPVLSTQVGLGLASTRGTSTRNCPESTTAWVLNENAARQVVTGLNPATVDRVHSLQIATPGLATGVHVNGQGGSSTLCRFPVNTDPGGVIQFEPINPIKNTYDMSGTRITRFRVELQDQHGEPVDTREEEYNCTIVIEYEIPSLATTGDN